MMDIQNDVIKFIEWEISRLDEAHPNSSDEGKILWANSKIAEELGELSEQVLSYLGYQRPEKLKKFNKENIAKEVADILLVVFILARRLDIDVEKALHTKMQIVTERIYKEDI